MKWNKSEILSVLKRIGIITLWVCLITGMSLGLIYANKQNQDVKCSSVIINIDPENELKFINREITLHAIREDGDENKILGKKIISLNTPMLENKIEDNKFIKSAQVFTDMNGILHIHIRQKVPVLRVINVSGHSFYIDNEGHKMPESSVFTAHVPVATGNIFESLGDTGELSSFVATELFKIATYVDKEVFWKAQIEQIFVNAESELILIPKVGEHKIRFGNTVDMEAKFKKLMLFYKEALSRIGWDKYSEIDLRFKDQIVCRKK